MPDLPLPEPLASNVPDPEPNEKPLQTKIADLAEQAADAALRDDDLDERAEREHENRDVLVAPLREAATRRAGKPVMAQPVLTLPRRHTPQAIGLYIHGGAVTSKLPVRRVDPAYLRVVPFARDVELRTRGQIGGAMLRLALRGWNDPEKPAVDDALWALKTLRQTYPETPVAIIGHSLGGRVALDVASQAKVEAVVGLAPWAADEYAAEPLTKAPLLIVHGRQDTVTSPSASEDLVKRVNQAGGDATFIPMTGWHAMLWHPAQWHRNASHFLIEHLLHRA